MSEPEKEIVEVVKKKIKKEKGFLPKPVLSEVPRRLRRPVGLSNLSTATTYTDHFQKPKGDGYQDPTRIPKDHGDFKYVINRLLDGSDRTHRPHPNPHERTVRRLSVWAHRDEPQSDFDTTHMVDYHPEKLKQGSPREMMKKKLQQLTHQIPTERLQKQQNAIEKLQKLVAANYGNTTKMFQACKKTKEDSVDVEEFENLMLRLNLDKAFPPADQRLLLESLPQLHGSGVSVLSIIGKVDTPAMEEIYMTNKTKALANASRIRKEDFHTPSFSIAPSRSHTNNNTASSTAFKGTNNSSNTSLFNDTTLSIKPATSPSKVGQGLRMTGRDANPLDLDTMIEDTYHRRTATASTQALAKYLQTSDINLEEVPFFDKRATNLNWRRLRASRLEEQVLDPKIQARMLVLEENKKTGQEIDRIRDNIRAKKMHDKKYGVEDNFVHPLGPKPKLLQLSTSNHQPEDNDDDSDADVSVVAVNNTDKSAGSPEIPLVGAALRSRAQNAALGVADRAAAKAQARRKGKKKDGFIGKGLGNPERLGNPAEDRSQEGTTIQSNEDSYLSAGLGKTNYLYDATESEEPDFYPMMPKLFSTKTKLEDPAMLLMMEPQYSEPHHGSTAKRMAPREPLDFGRVGVGSNSTSYEMPGLGSAEKSIDSATKSVWQQSVTSDYFPPLIYEPSKPVTRPLVSDAAKELVKRQEKRQARYERGVKNLEGTFKRLADFEFDKEIKQLYNVKSRNEDAIRYEANIFANDVRRFRSQPLQSMQKKGSHQSSDNMWGGTEGAVNSPIKQKDNRDFVSTHSASFFDNTSLRQSTGKLLFTGH